jgi:ABC-type uncharacterized transport system substrate-binding protein
MSSIFFNYGTTPQKKLFFILFLGNFPFFCFVSILSILIVSPTLFAAEKEIKIGVLYPLSGALARKWMEEVRENLLSRMNYNLGLVYQDGGLIVDGMARNLDRDRWDEIVKDFLLTS